MRINGTTIDNIGLIRVKEHEPGRYTLIIHPPARGGVLTEDGSTMMEFDVDAAEVRRIARVAPHLLAMSRRRQGKGAA